MESILIDKLNAKTYVEIIYSEIITTTFDVHKQQIIQIT